MTRHYYVSPCCNVYTGEMPLVDNHYKPTPEEIKRLKIRSLSHIGNERLQCKCGEVYSWAWLAQIHEN